MSGGGCCKGKGPGFANPLDAYKNSEKEKLLYIPCIVPTKDRPDYLVTIDVDEKSRDFGKVYPSCRSKYKTNLDQTYFMAVGDGVTNIKYYFTADYSSNPYFISW